MPEHHTTPLNITVMIAITIVTRGINLDMGASSMHEDPQQLIHDMQANVSKITFV